MMFCHRNVDGSSATVVELKNCLLVVCVANVFLF